MQTEADEQHIGQRYEPSTRNAVCLGGTVKEAMDECATPVKRCDDKGSRVAATGAI